MTCSKENQLHVLLYTVDWEPVLRVVIMLPTEPAGPFTFFGISLWDWSSHVEAATEMFMLQHITESLGAFHGDTTELVNQCKPQSYTVHVTALGKRCWCAYVCDLNCMCLPCPQVDCCTWSAVKALWLGKKIKHQLFFFFFLSRSLSLCVSVSCSHTQTHTVTCRRAIIPALPNRQTL